MAELETDCIGWFGYDTGLRLWFETNKGEDDAIPLYKDPQQRTEQEPVCPECKAEVLFECVACSRNNYPPQRPWVGLTEENWVEIGSRKNTVLDTFACGAVWAADQLKERNT